MVDICGMEPYPMPFQLPLYQSSKCLNKKEFHNEYQIKKRAKHQVSLTSLEIISMILLHHLGRLSIDEFFLLAYLAIIIYNTCSCVHMRKILFAIKKCILNWVEEERNFAL